MVRAKFSAISFRSSSPIQRARQNSKLLKINGLNDYIRTSDLTHLKLLVRGNKQLSAIAHVHICTADNLLQSMQFD
jgi:hypothetical protein